MRSFLGLAGKSASQLKITSFRFYPSSINSISNILHVHDTLAPVSIPDITATRFLKRFSSQIKHSSGEPPFSMAAGDFVEIYSSPDQVAKWDAVVTCFFLDTAPNVLAYLETIYRLLKPGGFWLNLGPLLYHWVADLDRNQDPRYDQSIEVSMFLHTVPL